MGPVCVGAEAVEIHMTENFASSHSFPQEAYNQPSSLPTSNCLSLSAVAIWADLPSTLDSASLHNFLTRGMRTPIRTQTGKPDDTWKRLEIMYLS